MGDHNDGCRNGSASVTMTLCWVNVMGNLRCESPASVPRHFGSTVAQWAMRGNQSLGELPAEPQIGSTASLGRRRLFADWHPLGTRPTNG